MNKTHAIRIALALGTLAALAALLPVLGMVALGLLTLVVPLVVVLSPMLVVMSLVFLADRLRDRRELASVPVNIGAPTLHAPIP